MTRHTRGWRGKRLFDLVGAAGLATLTAPICVVVACWVRLEAGRPILFVQERIGLDGKPFKLYKFRTMVYDAVGIALASGDSPDPYGVIKDDPRITRSGQFLRRTSLDELPQLINILRGDMSVVGPRPDIPEQVTHYSATDRGRLCARPGLTGYAQVLGRDQIDWPTRITLDREYILRCSFWLDMWVVLETIKEIVREAPEPLSNDGNARLRAQRNG